MAWILPRAFARDHAFRAELQARIRRSGAGGLSSRWATAADWDEYVRDELCGHTSCAVLYESASQVSLPPVVEVTEEPEVVVETDWIGFRVSDALGDPAPNVAVEVILPNDSRRIVYTDAMGVANLSGIPGGQCRVSVLGTHGDAWELQ